MDICMLRTHEKLQVQSLDLIVYWQSECANLVLTLRLHENMSKTSCADRIRLLVPG